MNTNLSQRNMNGIYQIYVIGVVLAGFALVPLMGSTAALVATAIMELVLFAIFNGKKVEDSEDVVGALLSIITFVAFWGAWVMTNWMVAILLVLIVIWFARANLKKVSSN